VEYFEPEKEEEMKALFILAAVSMGLVFVSGCSTTKSVAAKPLEPVYGDNVNLANYQVATVVPFQVTSSKAANAHAGAGLAEDIAHRLEYDFGPLFQTVRIGQPMGATNEVIITGRISDYQPGSRAARLLGPGIGKADLKGELTVKDGASGQPLIIAPIHKLWAWGHSIGAAKGMNDMMDETAASAANMIARAKGWEPAAQTAANR
jgi:hypothetical protein